MGNSKSKKVDPWEGFTDLHNICKARNGAALKERLSKFNTTGNTEDKKSIINAKAASGATPLHVAVSEDSYLCEDYLGPETNEEKLLDMAHALIAAGADINAVDKEHQTPLHLAVEANYSFIAGELVTTPGCDINIQDERGFSPLMVACLNGNQQIVEILLAAKADLHLISEDGAVNALVAAIAGNAKNIVRLLLVEHKMKIVVPPRLGEKYASLRQYANYNPPKRIQQSDQAAVDADREEIIQMLPYQSLVHYVCNSACTPLRNADGKVEDAAEQLTAVASGSIVKTFDLSKTKELADFRDLGHIEGHDPAAKAVWAVAFSPSPIIDNNGELRLLGATASEDKNNTIRIFDAQTTATIGEIFPENRVNSLAFSGDGSTLFAAANEGDIYCFDIKTLQEVGDRVTHPLKITRTQSLRSGGTGRNSSLSGRHGTGNTSNMTSPLAGAAGKANSVFAGAIPLETSRNISQDVEALESTQSAGAGGAASPLQRRGSSNQRMMLADTDNDDSVNLNMTYARDPEMAITQLIVSEDGEYLATTNKREVIVWNIIPGSNNKKKEGSSEGISKTPSKDQGHVLGTGGGDDSKSAALDREKTPNTTTTTSSSANQQQQNPHFDVFVHQPRQETEIPCPAVHICFNPRNKEIIYTMEIGSVSAWHVTSGTRVNTSENALKPDKEKDYFISMAISCDGRLLACGTASRRICVYDTDKWTLMRAWSIEKADKAANEKKSGDSLPRCLAFLPDTIHYAVLASGAEDGCVRFHVPESQSSESELVGEPIRVNHSIAAMAIAPHTGHCGGVFGLGLQADGGDEDSLPRTFSVTFGKTVDVKSATNVLGFEENTVRLKSGVVSMRFLSVNEAAGGKKNEEDVIEVVDQLGNKSQIVLDV